MKQVLIIAYYFPPLGMGGVQRAAKWTKYLPSFGWQPHIVTVKDIEYYAHDLTLLEDVRCGTIYRTESFDPARVLARFRRRNPIDSKEKMTFSRKGVDAARRLFIPDSKIGWYPFAWRKLVLLAERIRPDAVISTSPPLTAHLLGMKFRKKFQIPWVADFRDYWLGGEYLYAPTFLHHYLHKKWARDVVKTADAVISISEPIRRSFLSMDSADAEKFYDIPNGFDPDDFQRIAPEKLPRKSLLYLGSLGGANDPSLFFRALKNLTRKNPAILLDWKFLFVGKGISAVAVPPEIGDRLQFVPYVSHSKAIAFLKGALALLFTLSANVNPGMVTGKIFEYIGSGKPIFAISPEGVVATELLRSYNFGTLITDLNPEVIADKLEDFLRIDWGEKSPASLRGFQEMYSRKNQTEKLIDVLDQITSEKTRN